MMPTIDQTQRSTNLLLACDESCIKLFNDERFSCLHVADGTNKQFWRIVHPVISNRRLLRREGSPDKVPWRPPPPHIPRSWIKKRKKQQHRLPQSQSPPPDPLLPSSAPAPPPTSPSPTSPPMPARTASPTPTPALLPAASANLPYLAAEFPRR